jgi:TatD DNase family protein
MLKIIDSHCHLNLEPFHPQAWQALWQQAQAAGVIAALIPGVDLASSQTAVKLAQSKPELFAAVAIHPLHIESSQAEDKLKLSPTLLKQLVSLKQLAQQTGVKAIGETGLDYYHLPPDQELAQAHQKLQQQLFVKHLELANQVELPVVVHVRQSKQAWIEQNSGENPGANLRKNHQAQTQPSAYQQVLEILDQHYQFKKPVIFHCLSGYPDFIKQALEFNSYFSLAGNATYPQQAQILSLAKLIPKNRLLIETDAPYLTPEPQRTQAKQNSDSEQNFNQPAYIQHTARFVCQQLSVKPEQLLANTQQAFALKYD